jgi:hypothetical protein
MKLYQNGVSLYMGGTGTHTRAKRGEVVGWSAAAARRQRQWAWSVESEKLNGNGVAVTLTLAHTPENATEFHRLRRTYLMRIERMGLVAGHWVVEWQERGTPHLHMALYFDHELDAHELDLTVVHWVTIAGNDTSIFAQDRARIDGALGWLKYLAKHATRGIHHYQRQGHPEGWSKTGRLWGTVGAWPTVEPIEIDGLSNAEFYRIRRMMRAWAMADAKSAGDRRRMMYLARSRRTSDKQKSRYLGAADWVPETVMLRLVDYLERENVGGSREDPPV